LEQLDQDSIRTLAEGKSPKKGLLLDFIGNFARSAREGLPIYRIGGGAGFIWTASFEQKGRGNLRFTAVDASGLPSPSASQSPIGSQSPAQPTEIRNEVDAKLPELERTIEELQADLVVAASRVAELEKGKSEAERAVKEAEKAKVEAEQTRMSERVKLDAVIAQLQADKGAADAKNGGWKSLVYGGIGGLLVVATAFTAFFVMNRSKSRMSKHQVLEPETKPPEASAQPQAIKADVEPATVSSDEAIHELEKQLPKKSDATSS
jgi:hypothetical protein